VITRTIFITYEVRVSGIGQEGSAVPKVSLVLYHGISSQQIQHGGVVCIGRMNTHLGIY
jgi:hypothetical protein